MRSFAENDTIDLPADWEHNELTGPGLRILIVDDEPIDRGIFMRYLDTDQPGVFRYVEAETGWDGLRKTEAFNPDCILLDFHLPDMDGLGMLRLLHEKRETLPCAIVMLTGSGNEQVAVEAMKLGVMDYMTKGPASAFALSRTVAGAVQRFRYRQEIVRQRFALERRNRELEAIRAELFTEKERYKTLAEAIPQLVWTADSSGQIHYGNRRLRDFSGLADTGAQAIESLVHPDDSADLRSKWRRAVNSGEGFEMELRLWRARDGTWRRHLMRTSAMPATEEGRLRWFGTFTDIEDRKCAEEALWRREKQDSIGRLAGGMAHDFNNLLVGIMGGASLALSTLDRDHVAYPMMEAILGSSERAAHRIRQLLTYAGKSRFVPELADIPRTVRDACELVRASIAKNVRLAIETADDIPLVKTNHGDVRQVVVNLVMNAVEAIGEEAGVVTVKATLKRVDGQAQSHVPGCELRAGQYVSIEVADSGAGMDRQVQTRIFEPFFTTKFTGRGLGLAVVAGIVRSLGAGIFVSSAPGSGSLFQVLLPLGRDTDETTAAPEPRNGVPDGASA